jgi:hypothetical protein
MTCDEVRLDEYLDGELDPDARGIVESHLQDCAPCREEAGRSRGLESLLRKAAGGAAAPDADRFLASLRRRTRPSSRPPFLRAAAAAVLLLIPAVLFLWRPRSAERVIVLVSRYAQAPSAEIERQIAEAGPEAFVSLERILLEPETDERNRFAAASLLFKMGDTPTRDRVLASFGGLRAVAPAEGWLLGDPGTEDEDVEMVPAAISMAMEGEGARALGVLHKLHRLNASARPRIVEAVVVLLKSASPKVQGLAMEIVRELALEFPLQALVDLLEVPELGAEALRCLKQQTGKDFGTDRAAWNRVLKP